MGRIHIEIDVVNPKNVVLSTDQDMSRHDVLSREAKVMLLCNFFAFKVSYCPRVCNKAAHVMASHGPRLKPGSLMLWYNSIPSL